MSILDEDFVFARFCYSDCLYATEKNCTLSDMCPLWHFRECLTNYESEDDEYVESGNDKSKNSN